MTAQKIIETAQQYVGRNEGDATHRLFIDLYNDYGSKNGYPRGYKVQYSDSWCDVFVSTLFILNNCVNLIGGIECGVEEHVQIFKKKGIWIEDGTITPKPGYLIVYDWNTSTQPNNGYSDHIGLVEKVGMGAITTIEGNYSDSVKRRTISIGHGNIRGYAAPKYEEEPEDCYFVRDVSGKVLNSFQLLGNAMAEADRNGATVYDAEGRVIYTAEKFAYVNKDGAKVRKKAGATNKQTYFSPLVKGDKVQIVGETKSPAGNKWYKIRHSDKVGYMWAKLLSFEYIAPGSTMGRRAAANAKAIAGDSLHGYNNTKGKRSGNPDYACSSFVADCYIKSGVYLGCPCGDVYTKDMKKIFTKHGFKDVTSKVNLQKGTGLKIGDVLVKPGSHTEMYVGDGKLCGARGNANSGQPEHGKPGDQGGEIAVSAYYYFGQNICLRYSE